MARGGQRRPRGGLPPPLPPERRTVGQLVAETIQIYRANFLRALPLGIVVAAINQLTLGVARPTTAVVLLLAAPIFTASFVYACTLVLRRRPTVRVAATALAVGTIVFVPGALLFPWFALASVLWFALIGLAVPAVVMEETPFLASFRRGVELGRAGYMHAAGSLAALVILFVLTRLLLALLLESQADNTVRTAVFLSDAVLAPLLFLGGALLYVDQEARLRSRGDRGKERNAHLPDVDPVDRKGSSDAARESQPTS
jgi:hypothetical protein